MTNRSTSLPKRPNTARAGAFVGLAAGVLWLAAAVLSWGTAEAEGAAAILLWTGLALAVTGAALLGYSTVDQAPLWLRAFVTVAVAGVAYLLLVTIESMLESFGSGGQYIALLTGGILILVVAGGAAAAPTKRPRQGQAEDRLVV